MLLTRGAWRVARYDTIATPGAVNSLFNKLLPTGRLEFVRSPWNEFMDGNFQLH